MTESLHREPYGYDFEKFSDEFAQHIRRWEESWVPNTMGARPVWIKGKLDFQLDKDPNKADLIASQERLDEMIDYLAHCFIEIKDDEVKRMLMDKVHFVFTGEIVEDRSYKFFLERVLPEVMFRAINLLKDKEDKKGDEIDTIRDDVKVPDFG